MLYFPATRSNRQPIWEVLGPLVRPGARIFEVASGSGEHSTFFREKCPEAIWLTSDPEPSHRASIEAWTGQPALAYAVGGPLPELTDLDGVLAINLIHIAPWEVTRALMQAARTLLAPGGFLYLYGAYRQQGVETARSNEMFDQGLRAQNPAWGVRNLEDVVAAAEGLTLERVVAMPSNNLSVIFRKAGATTASASGADASS